MDCAEARVAIEISLDEPLDGDVRRTLDAHLLACPACVAVLREHVRTREALRASSARPPLDEAIPEPTVRRWVAAMRAATNEAREGGARSA